MKVLLAALARRRARRKRPFAHGTRLREPFHMARHAVRLIVVFDVEHVAQRIQAASAREASDVNRSALVVDVRTVVDRSIAPDAFDAFVKLLLTSAAPVLVVGQREERLCDDLMACDTLEAVVVILAISVLGFSVAVDERSVAPSAAATHRRDPRAFCVERRSSVVSCIVVYQR